MTDRQPIIIGSGSSRPSRDPGETVTRGRLPCPGCGLEQPAAEMTVGGAVDCPGCHSTICLQVDTIQRHGELVVVHPAERSPQTELPAEIAQRLEIREKLGHGGSGVVYRAYLRGAGHDVAVKLHDLSGFDTGKSFLTEVDLTSRLKHPNIVHIYFAGNPGGKPFAVYEIVEGMHLGQHLARHAPLSVPAFFELAFQLASALSHCHSQDIIHRDLKPANLLIADDVLKIADFGVGKNLRGSDTPKSKDGKSKELGAIRAAPEGTLTPEGHFVGTPMYMAPEVLTGLGQGKPTDVYAAGLIFYEMLVGTHPFQPKDLDDLFRRQLEEAPADPAKLFPAIPRPLSDLVLRCLAKRPEDRPVDGGALLEELREAARKTRIPEPVPDLAWGNLTQSMEKSPWILSTVLQYQRDVVTPVAAGIGILILIHLVGVSKFGLAALFTVAAGLAASACFMAAIVRMAKKTHSDALEYVDAISAFPLVILAAGGLLGFLFMLIAPYLVPTIVMGVTWLLMLCSFRAVWNAFCIQRMERELELMTSDSSSLIVESLPSGARVLKHPGGASMGLTPVRLRVTPGKLHIEVVKEGVGVRHVTIKVLPGREAILRVNLAGKQLLLPGKPSS